MPKIVINEVDNTIYGKKEVTSDNIVFIPGTATTGPSEPTLLASQADFKNIFGPTSPDSGTNTATAWDYANNLLMLGMPVLFKRITEPIDGSSQPLVKNAKTDISVESSMDIISSELSIDVIDEIFTVKYNRLVKANSVAMTLSNSEGTEIYSVGPKYGPWDNSNPEGTTDGFEPGEGKFEVSVKASPSTPQEDWLDPTKFGDGAYKIAITVSDSNNNYQDIIATFTKSSDAISNIVPSVESHKVAVVEATYGGTYGNILNYSIDVADTAYYFKVYANNKLLESHRIASISEGDTPADRNKKLLEGMRNLKTNSVKVFVEDESNFALSSVAHKYLLGGEDADESAVREIIPTVFAEYADKLIYNIKFITSGGYTDVSSNSTPIADAMIELAESRGDCLAVPDIPINLPEDEVTTFFANVNSSYAAAYAPWCYVKLYDKSEKWVCPSYVFLTALGKSVNIGNPIYLPPAGVKRAQLANVMSTEYQIGTAILDEWQSTNPQSINPIMKIYNYGYVIYGQRTLYSVVEDSATGQTSALQELSVRIVSNEIKRLIYNTAMYLTFDQNNLYTWNAFKARVEPELESMKSNNGITDFKVIMDSATTSNDDMNEGKIRGAVLVSVTHAAENFEIDFTLEQSSVTFDEDELTV